MKNLTIIYCGEDGDAGKALANSMRADPDNKVVLSSCEFFGGVETEAQKVIIMPDVPEHMAVKLREAYQAAVIAERDQTDRVSILENIISQQFPDIQPKRKPGRPRKVAA